MKRLVGLVAITSLSFAACTADGGSSEPAKTDDNSRALRSAEATTEVITLSSDFAQLGASTARSSIAPTDIQARVDGIVGDDCGTVEMTATSIAVNFDSCPGLAGSIEVTYPNGDCLDPLEPDPNCLDEGVTVTSTLEVEGVSIIGTFTSIVTETGTLAEGSLEIDVDGDELDIDFDVDISEDAAGCDIVNGTIDVNSPDGSVSVTADSLLDCGECPESGSLAVEADGQSVTIDFDSGAIEVIGADGEVVEATLTCEGTF